MAQKKKNEIVEEVVETTEVEEVTGFKKIVKNVLTKKNLIKAAAVGLTIGVGALIIKKFHKSGEVIDADIIETDDIE